jgi:hypothetical protein
MDRNLQTNQAEPGRNQVATLPPLLRSFFSYFKFVRKSYIHGSRSLKWPQGALQRVTGALTGV